ncbi:hypothetical protein I8748_27785 [Nostoc sp. CENA67]|uniref:Uncharacterized protein n=1 Tax=Amazonocrinis nigriterrae CENA67 TaxID=2794033 RepID=A0A8J7L9S3_9NOST|nr:hypothetical protein [Amazonocrinis nigriterrae]MBH8565924.1 hypothetical protein [Amazonocrinis nigriterrae CENA67]
MAKIERESINFKLPKPLVEALKAAAKERNTTATDLVIQGLHHVLGDVDGVETDVETRLHQIESSLEAKFEAKLEALNTRLAQLEGAMMMLQRNQNTRQKPRSAYSNYHSGQSPQLKPLSEKDLAWRFGTTAANLREKRENLKTQDFQRWCEDRDPSRVRWQYNEKDGLYHPVK